MWAKKKKKKRNAENSSSAGAETHNPQAKQTPNTQDIV